MVVAVDPLRGEEALQPGAERPGVLQLLAERLFQNDLPAFRAGDLLQPLGDGAEEARATAK
jgi:hypothetical protein